MAVDFEYYDVVGRVGLTVSDGPDADAVSDTLRPQPGAEVRFTPSQRQVFVTVGAEYEKRSVGVHIAYVRPDGVLVDSVADDGAGNLTYGRPVIKLPRLKGKRVNPPVADEVGDWETSFHNFTYVANQGTEYATTIRDPHTGSPILLTMGVTNDIGDPAVSTTEIGPGQPIVVGPRGFKPALSVVAGNLNVTYLDEVGEPVGAPVDLGAVPTVDAQTRASLEQILSGLRLSGAIGFTPTDIPGLHGWWDAKTITGVADGGVLSSWPAATATTAGAMTQATTAKRPTYSASGTNGRPAVRFDAANVQSLATAAFAAVGQPVTVFVVARHNGATVPALRVAFDSNGASGTRRQVYQQTSPKWSATNNAANVASTFNSVPAEPDVVTAVFADNYQAIRFGGIETTGPGAPATGTPTAWRIGANNADANPWDGWISEVIVYAARLTPAQIETVEKYLSARWGTELTQPGVRWIDPAIGNDSNHGLRRSSPKASTTSALASVVGGEKVVLRIKNDATTPIRSTATNWLVWDEPRALTLEPWDNSAKLHVYGSTQVTSGWTSEGNSVWSRTHTANPGHLAVPTMGHPDKTDMPDQLLPQTTNIATPAAATFTYDAATQKLRIRLRDSSDPNTHKVEIPLRNSAVLAQGTGPVYVRRMVARYWRNPGLYALTPTDVTSAPATPRGKLYADDCETDYCHNGVATLGYPTEVICNRHRARFVINDGYNHHASPGHVAYMELNDCEGAYNGDEGASPHDDTWMKINRGSYHHNRGGGGITAVNQCRLDVDGPAVFANKRDAAGAPLADEGGVSFYEIGTTGSAKNVKASANHGPGLYVRPGAAVTVDFESIAASRSASNAAPDVVPA